jgi:hypothetical protein
MRDARRSVSLARQNKKAGCCSQGRWTRRSTAPAVVPCSAHVGVLLVSVCKQAALLAGSQHSTGLQQPLTSTCQRVRTLGHR